MRRILCSLAILLAVGLHAQNPGDLDLSFDGDGKLVVADIDSMGDPFAVPTSDLGLIIGFNRTVDGQQQTCLLRLNEDGSVNSSYGDQGLMVSTAQLQLKDVLIRTDDKVLLVGQVPGQEILRVERYLADGALDLSYGDAGVWETVIPDTIPNSFVSGGLMLPDDRILVNGSFGVIRVLADGGVDEGFGLNGVFAQGGKGDLALAPDGDLRWTIIKGNVPFSTDYDAQVNGGSLGFNSSCGGLNSNELYGDLKINSLGNFVSRSKTCWFPMGAAITEYNLSVLRYVNHPAGGLTYSPINSRIFLSHSYNMGYSHQFCSELKFSTDEYNNFYGIFSLHYATSFNQYDSDLGVIYTYYEPVWSIQKYNENGVRAPWNVFPTVMEVRTRFIEASSTENIAEYPTPTVLYPTPNGKLLAVGYCEIDSVKRIVAARYHATPDPRTRANIRVFLGGNYDANTGLMHDSLRAAGLVPQLAPYDAPQYLMANGRGGFATPTSVLAVEGDSAVVDWVWLELMRDTLPGMVVATRVALVLRNGRVTANDGRSPVDFGIGAGNYLLRVRHRNHLSATTLNPVTLGLEPVTIDFTDPATATYGTDAQMEVNGVRMLWPGQTNNDGLVRYAGSMNDRDRVLQAIGGTPPTAVTTGYRTEDLNMDGTVKYAGANNDRDMILQTIGGTVPTAVRIEQTP